MPWQMLGILFAVVFALRREIDLPLADSNRADSGRISSLFIQSRSESIMVHATIRMLMEPKDIKETLEILRRVVEHTRVEPGCISCCIYQDVQQERAIMLEELWSSQEDLRTHLCSTDYQRILLLLEMAHTQPEIRFSTILASRGFEAIAEARSRPEETA